MVVETKSAAASPMDRLLWSRGVRPTRISKYATGLAALDPALPHNRWSRTLRRHFYENTMKLTRITAAISAAAIAAALAGCGSTHGSTAATASTTSATSSATATAGASVTAVLADNQESHASAEDLAYTESDVVDVTLSGSTATADGDGVKFDGATVTITAPGTYRLSGTLAGQVVVDTSATGDVRVTSTTSTITFSTTSAIAVMAAGISVAVVILADGSTNSLTDGFVRTATSTARRTPRCTRRPTSRSRALGALTVTGHSNDGIGAQDGLVISSGTTVTVTAKDDAIRGKDYVRTEAGTTTATGTDGDALKSDNVEDADRGYVAVLGGTVDADGR